LIHLGGRGELRVSADTSSAAGTTPAVGPAAAAFPALTAEPMPCSVKATDPMVSVRRITTMLLAE
jgi:hypothetical protein